MANDRTSSIVVRR